MADDKTTPTINERIAGELERARESLWQAEAIVSLAVASFPNDVRQGDPSYRLALQGVQRSISEVTGKLEPAVFMETVGMEARHG